MQPKTTLEFVHIQDTSMLCRTGMAAAPAGQLTYVDYLWLSEVSLTL